MTTTWRQNSGWWRMFAAHPMLTVSAAQKAALARILESRYRRLSSDELYRIDGWPLPELTEAITIDTALILIGLFECLEDPDQAEMVLREIVVLFLRSLHLSDEARSSVNPRKLDLRHQLEMLRIWMQYRESSPMALVLRFAAFLLFRDQIEVDGESGATSRQLTAALFPDAWALYSKTLSLFGRTLDADRTVTMPNSSNSTAPRLSIRAA
jgi:hypothetical protein